MVEWHIDCKMISRCYDKLRIPFSIPRSINVGHDHHHYLRTNVGKEMRLDMGPIGNCTSRTFITLAYEYKNRGCDIMLSRRTCIDNLNVAHTCLPRVTHAMEAMTHARGQSAQHTLHQIVCRPFGCQPGIACLPFL